MITSPDTLLRDNEDSHLLKQNASIQDDGAKHPCDSSATGEEDQGVQRSGGQVLPFALLTILLTRE